MKAIEVGVKVRWTFTDVKKGKAIPGKLEGVVIGTGPHGRTAIRSNDGEVHHVQPTQLEVIA